MVAFPLYQTLDAARWRVHASAVVLGDAALLILGPPASGKSTHTAYFLAQGATLIGDDYLILTREGEHLHASPVPEIAAVLALDGCPLMQLPYRQNIRLTHCLILAETAGNPLSFTGCVLTATTKPTGDVVESARVFVAQHCETGAVLPVDWIPQLAQKP